MYGPFAADNNDYPHRILFKAQSDWGLPIGDLRSQFFANLHSDGLDQVSQHRVKAMP